MLVRAAHMAHDADAPLLGQVRWVCLDVGETLIDETRHWAGWAEWLGVTHLTFFAALGAVIAGRRDHREVFQLLRPDFNLAAARAALVAAGWPEGFGVADLYPDVRPTLARLRAGGLRIAIAGNQPLWAEAALDAIGLPADLVAASDRWGVHKPSPAFFERLAHEAGAPAAEIAYVGDRLDNDVLPARAAGMWAVFLRRGPWGHIHATWPERDQAHVSIERLDELPPLLRPDPGSGPRA
jgi:HAD superfamily hydrolase (TIGR01549 family)